MNECPDALPLPAGGAAISPDAGLGANVTLGHYVTIHAHVAIGDGTTVFVDVSQRSARDSHVTGRPRRTRSSKSSSLRK
jgi:UDP-3-O-[3-hydroxymyristoyl] glucosamine N-acyltransferase